MKKKLTDEEILQDLIFHKNAAVKYNFISITGEQMCMWLDFIQRLRNEVKDTASGIFEKFLGYIGSQQQFCIVDEEHKTFIDCDKLFDFVGNLAKEYDGVEL